MIAAAVRRQIDLIDLTDNGLSVEEEWDLLHELSDGDEGEDKEIQESSPFISIN